MAASEPDDLQRLVNACLDFLLDAPNTAAAQPAIAAVHDLLVALGYLPPS